MGEDRSRSLMLSGSFAQLCSSARLAVPALLALLRALLRDLENLSAVTHGAQIFQVRRAASDARERSVYRKTVLTRIDGKRQQLATYGWTDSPARDQATPVRGGGACRRCGRHGCARTHAQPPTRQCSSSRASKRRLPRPRTRATSNKRSRNGDTLAT